MPLGHHKELPPTQKQSDVVCATGASCTGTTHSIPVGGFDAEAERRQHGGQPANEIAQVDLPLTIASGACDTFSGPEGADVAESPLPVEAVPSIVGGPYLADSMSPSSVVLSHQGVPDAAQHALRRAARELGSSPPVCHSDPETGEGNEDNNPCSTEPAQAENEDVLEHSSPDAAPHPPAGVEKPGEFGGNMEEQNDADDSSISQTLFQGAAGEKPLSLEDTLTSNAASEHAAADDVTPSDAIANRTVNIEDDSSTGSNAQSSQQLEAHPSKTPGRRIAYSVAPFVPFVGRPTKAAQRLQSPEVEAKIREETPTVESEGAVSSLGRRVSLALRSAYSIFGKVATAGRQHPAQREEGSGISHAAVGWLRRRSSDMTAAAQGGTAVGKEEVRTQNVQAAPVEGNGTSSVPLSHRPLSSTPPVVQRTPPVWPVGDVSMEESDRQTLAYETKRWGRRFTTVNTHEPRADGTGPTLNPFRRTHRTEEFVETHLQPIPKKK